MCMVEKKKTSYARVWMLNVLGTKPLLILHFEVPLYIHYFQDTNQSFLEKKNLYICHLEAFPRQGVRCLAVFWGSNCSLIFSLGVQLTVSQQGGVWFPCEHNSVACSDIKPVSFRLSRVLFLFQWSSNKQKNLFEKATFKKTTKHFVLTKEQEL